MQYSIPLIIASRSIRSPEIAASDHRKLPRNLRGLSEALPVHFQHNC